MCFMEWTLPPRLTQQGDELIGRGAKMAMTLFRENAQRTEQLINSLPTNRELINKIYKYGFQKI